MKERIKEIIYSDLYRYGGISSEKELSYMDKKSCTVIDIQKS